MMKDSQELQTLIIDCHTHLWNVGKHLGTAFVNDYVRVYNRAADTLESTPDIHLRGIQGEDRAVVLGFKSLALGVSVPNEYVARYVDEHPDRLIGFCSVDPNDPQAASELRRNVTDLHLNGVKLAPIYQHFDPNSEIAGKVFATAQELEIPVLIHQGTTFVENAPLRYAYPSMLDEVATHYPDLKMIVAHLGHPWEDETIALIRKQRNVYADISALYFRPYRFYLKLVTCLEYGVTHKLLFGSDFPFSTPKKTLASLNDVNDFAAESAPRIPNDVLISIVEKNALTVFKK